MNKKERVEAALRGEAVDRVPVSLWGHDYAREWSAQGLAEAMVEEFTRYDWDYLKVNPRASYLVESWGASYLPSNDPLKPPVFKGSPIRNSSDWKRLRPLEPDQKTLAEQLHALELINHAAGYEAYVAQTIFCPLGTARYLVGGDNAPVQYSIREDRSAMHRALRVITETLINFAIASLEYGASGIFYATNGWASSGMLTPDQYREYGEQYDLEFFDAIKSRSKLTILHNCGSHIYFDQLASYPVDAISWDVTQEGNPDLREGKLRSGKAVMGGINEKSTLLRGSPGQVQDEIGQTLEMTGSTRLLLAPGCAIAPETPTKNKEAVRRAVS
ncbi:MAG TPA: uroporphyrinogen decarboxylase family protein [Ktedonobacteraceae bacterium]|jgi:uroporphyrinogen decarboxylase